jgi:dUTP pyrophosphatase
MKIKIKKIDSNAVIPKYAHEYDAGMDLYSIEDYVLKPMEKKIFKIGLKIEISKGYYGSIRDRSGLAAKYSIHVLAGVIDSNYRGEVGIVLINLGQEDFNIGKGDRIAQILIQPIETAEIEDVEDVSETERGEGCFGSTGK